MVNGEVPESLFQGDQKAFVFYVLANKQIATCKKAADLPYHKQRSSYLSSGVYSPALNKVSFWGDALEIPECMKILIESKTVEPDAKYVVAGGRKMTASHSGQVKSAITGATRKGHAGFNRLPARGTDKLTPQTSTAESRPNLKQKEMPASTQNAVINTPSGKIEIRTGMSKDLRQQSVPRKATPRNT